MNEKIKQYLDKHIIQKFVSGYIIDDPIDFVSFISGTDYYIEEIIWWDHIETENSGNSLHGGGGPLDIHDKRYYYSETNFVKRFKEYENDKCREYVSGMLKQYSDHDLRPLFYISVKGDKKPY